MAFVKICGIKEVLNGKGKSFIVNSQDIAVFNLEGKYYAVQNKCPHAGVGLSGGFVDGNNITCPGHGWQFDIKTGEHAFMPVCLKTYGTKILGEDLLIEI